MQISVEVRTVRHVLPNSNPSLSVTVTSDGSGVILPSLSPHLAPQDLWSAPPHHSLSPSLKYDMSHERHHGRYKVDRLENSVRHEIRRPQQSFIVGLRSPPQVRISLLPYPVCSIRNSSTSQYLLLDLILKRWAPPSPTKLLCRSSLPSASSALPSSIPCLFSVLLSRIILKSWGLPICQSDLSFVKLLVFLW